MAHRHRRFKKHYTIAVTSDYSADKTKYYKSRFNIFKVMLRTMILVVVLGAGLTAFEFYELDQMESKVRIFKDIISEQEDMIDQLGAEKAELTSENEILNNTVAMNLKEQEEEEKEYEIKHLPTGFPLTGSATVGDPEEFFAEEMDSTTAFYEAILARTEEDDSDEEDDSITVLFVMSEISDVVAAADGTVISITSDDVYGYSVEIDHENGYITYYKNNSEPKVNVGDEVVKGAIIYVGGEENDYLGYQINYNGEWVDPLKIISIEG